MTTRRTLIWRRGIARFQRDLDAIFRPFGRPPGTGLARQADVQARKTTPCFAISKLAYFDVQQARGILAGVQDSVAKGRELVKRTTGLARGLVAEVEVNRARAQLFDLQQQEAAARASWRIASCPLDARFMAPSTPAAVVAPAEVPYLQITPTSPRARRGRTDSNIGLTSRPELRLRNGRPWPRTGEPRAAGANIAR